MDMSWPPMDASQASGNANFVLVGASPAAHAWLSRALAKLGTVHLAPGSAAEVAQVAGRVGAVDAGVVFLHFEAQQALACTRLGQQLAQRFPQVPLVALADSPQPELMLAALRAGVKDFVDMREPAAAATVAQRLLLACEQAAPARRGKVLAVLGARPGVGATTLALHLAAMAAAGQHGQPHGESRAEQRAESRDALLLDLGLPARDGALYANLTPGFHFVDAVRNLRRFDPVFVQTALTRHARGFAVLPLPPSLAELRDIATAEALSLLDTLRGHFDLQVIDLGGFSHLDVMAQLVNAADEVLVVAEQSVGAIVSAAELIEEMRRRDAAPERMKLVVSRLQPRAGIDAAHIAQRLALPLAGTLPDCRERLLAATNAGALLGERDGDDPYRRAVRALLASLGLAPAMTAGRAGWPARLRASLRGWPAARPLTGSLAWPVAAMVRRLAHRTGQAER